jgi:hypothetical protein
VKKVCRPRGGYFICQLLRGTNFTYNLYLGHLVAHWLKTAICGMALICQSETQALEFPKKYSISIDQNLSILLPTK